jgi:hypothetical protein
LAFAYFAVVNALSPAQAGFRGDLRGGNERAFGKLAFLMELMLAQPVANRHACQFRNLKPCQAAFC